MKKLVYILMMFVIVFSSCDPNEEIYDELDNAKLPFAGTIPSYIFNADDYSTASKAAKIDAVSIGDNDSTYANLIKSMEAFNSYYPAEDYVGSVLADAFPEYGKKSRAYVTYNYVAELPEDLATYTNATEYKLDADDYASIGENVEIAGYLFPEFNPDFYIANVLNNSISGVESGDIYRISYKYSEVNPVIGPSTTFKESFDNGLGKFDTTNVLGSKNWYVSSYEGSNYMSMSGYKQNTEDWLISNPIELSNDANISFNFTHEIKYLNHQWDQLSVLISDDYDGSDIAGATWNVIDWGLVADTANLGSGYDPYNSGDIDITAYANSTIYIAFKYTSTIDNAATWHILDVMVDPIKETDESIVIYGKTPYAKNDFYEYSGSDWSKVEGVYCLSDADYAAMGDPGDDDMFSADVLPQDYLPNFLSARYPEAGSGVSKTIVYQYDSDLDGEITLATEYTYGDEGWESAYNYIQEATNQFVHNGTEWLFDPTITVEMGSTDYQIIVEYVKNNISADLLDSYGTFESYYGAGSYYRNFDIGAYDKAEFGSGDDDWQNAVEEAIGLRLLPVLFPDAQLQANGVDMYYRVIFQTFKSGTKTNYAMNFQVTKAGPNPEFTLDENGAVEQ